MKRTLPGRFAILAEKPNVTMGARVPLVTTPSQFGIWVSVPVFFTHRLGSALEEWPRLLTVMMGMNPAFVVFFSALGDRWSQRGTAGWLGGVLSAAEYCLDLYCLDVYCLPVAVGHNFLVAAVAAGAFGAGMAKYVPLPPLLTAPTPEHKGQVMSVCSLGPGERGTGAVDRHTVHRTARRPGCAEDLRRTALEQKGPGATAPRTVPAAPSTQLPAPATGSAFWDTAG
ncbi:hypothetical protein [Streptomyces roseochromogenus]|uniref:Uncharacterized protein n=1 Tax=Streptomyces roseochromogenus subsp. oscitans DS 12.976 TaxID=1352936 RepID=V6KVR7_STRRC|nr:hypothetical protein [Streptomyces roseochromogenus]EST36113.1 hypothetical protein M878_03155 [Streptomyces roseochromogenus subsp. oscitans DS 12.976]